MEKSECLNTIWIVFIIVCIQWWICKWNTVRKERDCKRISATNHKLALCFQCWQDGKIFQLITAGSKMVLLGLMNTGWNMHTNTLRQRVSAGFINLNQYGIVCTAMNGCTRASNHLYMKTNPSAPPLFRSVNEKNGKEEFNVHDFCAHALFTHLASESQDSRSHSKTDWVYKCACFCFCFLCVCVCVFVGAV